MFILVRDLPPVVQRALESVQYHKADISVRAASEVNISGAGGAGRKAFTILVNFQNNTYQTHWGSWGGANMFNPKNPVDLDRGLYQLPPHGAVISGEIGGTTYADIRVHLSQMQNFLPQPTELTQEEKDALYCYRSIKGGSYRREELARRNVSQAIINKLLERGLLKQDGRGIAISLDGKNAIDDYQGY